MNESFAIQLFEGKKVRIVWDAEQEKYYFSVTDIVQVLTDSVNPRDYIKKMLRRDPELKSKWGTICPPVEMLAPDGKRRKTQAADLEGIFRIIQAIWNRYQSPVPVPLFHEPPKDKVEIFRLPPYLSWNRYFDLFGVAEEQFEALVDAGCQEVVALGMSCRLRAEILLRKDAVEYCQ